MPDHLSVRRKLIQHNRHWQTRQSPVRCFIDLVDKETAEVLAVSPGTVMRDLSAVQSSKTAGIIILAMKTQRATTKQLRCGITNSDRPVGIKRNSGKTPPQYNMDLRYSRFFNFNERSQLEVFGEFQNLFNINTIVQFNNVTVTTNANGELAGRLPDFKARNQSTSLDSRQFQLGFKFVF